MHGNRLIHRYGIGGFRRGSLGQCSQTIGEIIDAGIAGGRLQILEAIIDQPTESFFAPLAGTVLVSLHIEHASHTGGKVLRRGRLAIGLGLGRRRRCLGLCLAGSRNMTALLHGHAHSGESIERVGLGIEIAIRRCHRCLRRRHRWRDRYFHFGLLSGDNRCRLRNWRRHNGLQRWQQ
ncbi:hypothetical protein FQZ97_1026200 [compost metagenome]